MTFETISRQFYNFHQPLFRALPAGFDKTPPGEFPGKKRSGRLSVSPNNVKPVIHPNVDFRMPAGATF
jgi:hypothetical protein